MMFGPMNHADGDLTSNHTTTSIVITVPVAEIETQPYDWSYMLCHLPLWKIQEKSNTQL